MLQIKDLHAGYNGLDILKRITLSIKKSEIVALIGPNGAGKSTLLRSIFNLAEISKGDILFEGKSIVGLKPYELIKKGLCYVNQGRVIFENLRVEENLRLGIKLKPAEREARFTLVYKQFPFLQERRKEFAYVLSGGERRMLSLGRALIQQPSLLLLDEPSLGLSPKIQTELFKTIAKLRDIYSMSLLIVEQNAKKALEIADRTYLLEDGAIVLQGSGKKILRHRKIKQVYLGGRY